MLKACGHDNGDKKEAKRKRMHSTRLTFCAFITPFILLWHSLFLPAFQVVCVEPTANDGDAIPQMASGKQMMT
jgi:hypothetical protein